MSEVFLAAVRQARLQIEQAQRDRNKTIAEAAANGHTLEAIGREARISRGRVHQILSRERKLRQGVPSWRA